MTGWVIAGVIVLVVIAAIAQMRQDAKDEAESGEPPPTIRGSLRSIGLYGPDGGRVHGSDVRNGFHNGGYRYDDDDDDQGR